MAGTQRNIKDWLEPLSISSSKLSLLTHKLSATYTHLALHSEDQFLATPVSTLPTGRERGEFLAIDLGGSNLRVAFVKLLGQSPNGTQPESLAAYDQCVSKSFEQSWPIGEHLKTEKPEHLFAWLGDCLAEVIQSRYEKRSPNGEDVPQEIPLGITFSFPMMQTTLAEATLLPMGKGFALHSNPDLGSMVLAGFEKHTATLPRVKIVAIANDTVSTLISLMYSTNMKPESEAVIGLIIGTGCNAAVPMRREALRPSKCASMAFSTEAQKIIVNTEWTLRGGAPPLHELGLYTAWDAALDAGLSTPGFQPFEYMTAGLYLGEIIRLIALDYAVENLGMSLDYIPLPLTRRNGLTTAFLSRTVALTEDVASLVTLLNGPANQALETMTDERPKWTAEVVQGLLLTERAVLHRSALMTAAAIVALLLSTGYLTSMRVAETSSAPAGVASSVRELLVAYCGGLICIYRSYKEQLQRAIDYLVQDCTAESDIVRVILWEASEGGVIGAGVLAGTVWPAST